MHEKIYPQKLSKGDEIRVIAPSRSMALFPKVQHGASAQRFTEMSLKLSYGEHIWERDAFDSSSIKYRIGEEKHGWI